MTTDVLTEHTECDCVPDLGPSHCHGCHELVGRAVPWDEAVNLHTQATAADIMIQALREQIAATLNLHHPTTGMAVSSGTTCACGYWTGSEPENGKRPLPWGRDRLDLHRADVMAELMAALYGEARTDQAQADIAAIEEHAGGIHSTGARARVSNWTAPRANAYTTAVEEILELLHQHTARSVAASAQTVAPS